ncbi:MAG: TonB-dependent receptor [Croceibacterium sp.]
MPRSGFYLCCCVLAFCATAARAQTQESPPILQPPTDVQPGSTPQRIAPVQPSASVPAAIAPGPLVYTPADFAQYAPRSALDMLQQVPGFNIQESFGQGRGLGEATGNVLLNGERISSKSDSVSTRLSRIAAANVIRIEFVDGATLDIPGLSGRVANIIARQSQGIRGQFEWTPQLPTDFAQARWTGAKVSVTGSQGPVGYTLAIDNSPFIGGTGGPNFITDRFGVVEQRFSQTDSVMQNPKVSGQFRIDGPGSSIGNFSAAYQWSWLRSGEDENVVAAAGAPSLLKLLRSRNDGHNYEIGGDVEFAAGPGRLKLIGLESFRQSTFSTELITDPDTGAARYGSRFTQASNSGEHIARGEYRWKMFGGDVQLSGEAAYNRLNNVAGFALLTTAGDFRPIPFPSGTGGVTEDRYEGILSFGRPLAHNVTLQVSAGGEYSQIAQTGANALSRSFKRPKGSLSLSWKPSDGMDVSFKAARKVGQLNFSDFLADVNLQNNNTNAGNNELRPQQSWEFDVQLSKSLGQWGSMTVNVSNDYIQDYVAVVPLPSGGESVGNIDSARSYGVQLNSTIRFDPLGIPGAKVDVDLSWLHTQLSDPLTGLAREFDKAQPYSVNVQFRHDLPGSNWAYGASVRTSGIRPYYRLAEFGYDHNLRTALGVFVENKDVFGLTVQARLNNILENQSVLDRYVYAGPRNSAPLLFHEDRRREVGHLVNFTVKGNF